jgi:hypothetical protein
MVDDSETKPIGYKRAIKRMRPILGDTIRSGCYVQPKGAVTRTVLSQARYGAVGGALGSVVRMGLRQLAAPKGPMPNLMLLGTTDTELILYAARGNYGKVEEFARFPLDAFLARVEERLIISRLTIQFQGDQGAEELVLDTKRIGANRHNTGVFRDVVARCAGPAADLTVPGQAADEAQPAK